MFADAESRVHAQDVLVEVHKFVCVREREVESIEAEISGGVRGVVGAAELA